MTSTLLTHPTPPHLAVSQVADSSCMLVQRGLRVRMGMHSGLHDGNGLTYNKASGRTQYTGELITIAKRCSDTAHGGQVTMTDETYRQLPLRALARRAWVLHMGQVSDAASDRPHL